MIRTPLTMAQQHVAASAALAAGDHEPVALTVRTADRWSAHRD